MDSEKLKTMISEELYKTVQKVLENGSANNLEKEPTFKQPKFVEETNRRFYVMGLKSGYEKENVKEMFSKFGKIAYIESDQSNSCFVTFFEKPKELLYKVSESKNEKLIFEGKTMNEVETFDSDIPSTHYLTITTAPPKKFQVFIGGLKRDITVDDVVRFFSQFGEVHDATVKCDPKTGISRCFGFVTYIDCDHVIRKLCKERFVTMFGKKVEVRGATRSANRETQKYEQKSSPSNVNIPRHYPSYSTNLNSEARVFRPRQHRLTYPSPRYELSEEHYFRPRPSFQRRSQYNSYARSERMHHRRY